MTLSGQEETRMSIKRLCKGCKTTYDLKILSGADFLQSFTAACIASEDN